MNVTRDSHPVPRVFISLRLHLFRYESHIQNQSFPFPFLSLWNERHILFHSETKDTSYTPTIPFLSFKIIHFESEKYLFFFFRLFHIFSFILLMSYMCWKPKLYPSCSVSFTLKRKTLLLISTRKESSLMPQFFSMGLAGGKNTTYTPAIPPSKNTIYTSAIPPRKNRTSLIIKRLPMNDLIFYFRFIS